MTSIAVADVLNLLQQLLQPDSQVIRQAEEGLKQVTAQPACVQPLFTCAVDATACPHPQLRQLAAIVLRKKIMRHWRKFTYADRNAMQATILSVLRGEQSAPVRAGLVGLVVVIAKATLPSRQWDELLPTINTMTNATPIEQESAIRLIGELTETMPHIMGEHAQVLSGVIGAGLGSPHGPVQKASLIAMTQLVEGCDNEEALDAVRNLIPPALQVAQAATTNGQSEAVGRVIEMLSLLAEQTAAPVLQPHLSIIVPFCSHVLSDAGVDDGVRIQALEFVRWLVHTRPKSLNKKGMVPALVQALLEVSCEEEDEDEADEAGLFRYAIFTLDSVACNAPSRVVLPATAAFVHQQSTSTEWACRRAAACVLGVIAEGCENKMRKSIGDWIQSLLRLLSDAEPRVRAEAATSAAEIVSYLQPEVLDFTDQLLPALGTALADGNDTVAQRVMGAVESLCEVLEDGMAPYAPQLIQTFLQMLDTASMPTREAAASVVGSIMNAVKSEGVSYAPEALRRLSAYLGVTEEEQLTLRARCLESAGVVLASMGQDQAKPIVGQYLVLAMQSFEIDWPELRDSAYGFCSNAAEILEEGISEALPALVPKIYHTLHNEDGILELDRHVNTTSTQFAGLNDSSDEEDDDQAVRGMTVKTSLTDEKASAAHLAGVLSKKAGPSFIQHGWQLFEPILHGCSYFHDEVRGQSAKTAALFCGFFTQHDAANPKVQQVLGEVAGRLFEMTTTDDSKEVCSDSLTAVGTLFEVASPALMASYVEGASQAIMTVLTEKAVCQTLADDEDDDEESEDHDGQVMDTAAEAFEQVAKCFGSGFAQTFATFLPVFTKMAKPSKADNSRVAGTGVLAEVSKSLGPAVSPYLNDIGAIMMRGLGDDSQLVRRNCAYGCGVLAMCSPQQVLPSVNAILAAMQPLLQKNEEAGVRDNAVSAICRMIQAGVTGEGTPGLFAGAMSLCPLKADANENQTVLECVAYLHAQQPELVNTHAGAIIRLVSGVLANPALMGIKDIQQPLLAVTPIVKQWHGQHGDSIFEALSGCPASWKEAIVALIQA